MSAASPPPDHWIPPTLDYRPSLENDDVVKTMRTLGHKGPITPEM
jgi:hypothetical protein